MKNRVASVILMPGNRIISLPVALHNIFKWDAVGVKMKNTIVSIAAFCFLSTAAYAAGVSKIENNGTISGVPSYRVQCTSGSSHIIYQKNGTWYHGTLGDMGSKYNSWSTSQVAEYACGKL